SPPALWPRRRPEAGRGRAREGGRLGDEADPASVRLGSRLPGDRRGAASWAVALLLRLRRRAAGPRLLSRPVGDGGAAPSATGAGRRPVLRGLPAGGVRAPRVDAQGRPRLRQSARPRFVAPSAPADPAER